MKRLWSNHIVPLYLNMKDISIVNEIPLGATQLVIPIKTQSRAGINRFTYNNALSL